MKENLVLCLCLFLFLFACAPAPTVLPPIVNVTSVSETVKTSPTFTPSPLTMTPAPLTRTVTPTNALPNFSHIFVIIFENKSYSDIFGNSNAPFFNLLAAQFGLATRFYAVTHPSLPNYIALTAGSPYSITSDCTNCFLPVQNLADQVEASRRTWRAYFESMPSPCYRGNSQGIAPLYAQKHNPFIYYDNIRNNPARCANLVPLTNLDADLASGAYNLMWITPNMCNSMHDCSVATGDKWLKQIAPKILSSDAFRNNGALFVLFDEGLTNAGCCTHATGGQVFSIVASPLAKRGFQSANAYDHYSLLATIEDAWNLPRLQYAACPCTRTLGEFFSSQ